MTTDELLSKLPRLIGRNPIYDKDHKIIAYSRDGKEGSDVGWLTLRHLGNYWEASYRGHKYAVCMNPETTESAYNNAICYGETANEALQELYNWCVENNFIKYENN